MNMISDEGDGFDELKKAFEIGLDLLKASLSETMKNSNDVLTFWFAFLSVIMVVFSFAGYFINNNILEQSKYQLKMVEKEAEQSIKNIKVETQKLIDENNKYIRISQLFNFGEDSGKNKDYNSVIKYNLEIIKLYGDIENIKDKNHINNYAGAFYNIGTAKYELKIYDEAIEYLNKAIELNPYFSNAYVYRGMVYYQLEKYSEALKDYNKAIYIDFNNEYAYTNRGLIKEKLGDYQAALEDYNKAIELNKNNIEAYTNRGLIKEKLEDYQGAIEDYDKAIELKPQDSKLYFDRYIVKQILLKNKDSEEYKKFFDDVYNDLDTAYNLANEQLKEIIKNKIINIAIQKNEVAIKFCENKGLNIKDIIIYIEGYISKSLLLSKITDENSEEYKKSFDDVYNDLNIAYNLANKELKEIIKNQIIGMAIEENEVAIKFCKDKGWDIK
ncbi:tetratricopeptide repeat protein [Brachyspira pulli]|uniref:tetratricopeptide repeat protein n=1 Tax=Brachyspira pulli TaxID=310721 RepID=UPI003004CE78